MKKNPTKTLMACRSFEDANERKSNLKASSHLRHSVVLSSLPPDFSRDDEILERSLKELVRYYRHSSVGRRCLGIVHQLNTPLQVLSLQLDLLEQKDREEQELISTFPQTNLTKLQTPHLYRQKKYHQLRNELEKLKNFAQSLILQGMHEDGQEKIQLDLNQMCRQELDLYLIDPVFKHQITRNFHFGEGTSIIYGHYIDFSQSFRNLIDNALDAMEGVERRQLTVETICQEKSFTLRIGDTGVGIPPENLSWIFESFFTTKRTGSGVRSGLGLFMVRRLLALYQAEIRIDSVPGETWVTVSIPVA